MKKDFKKMRAIEINMAQRLIGYKKDTAVLTLEYLQDTPNSSKLIHDYKTPLTALNLNLDVQCPLNSEYIELALKSARQLFQLIQKNKYQTKDIFYIYDEINYCKNLVGKTAKINMSIEGEKLIFLHGSKMGFRRIITNLLNNAAEATKVPLHKEQIIKIIIEEKSSCIEVKVEDKGEGIQAKYLKHVFEENFSTKKGNTGLGLTICKDIVENIFKGQIKITSKPNQGTQVKLILPKTK